MIALDCEWCVATGALVSVAIAGTDRAEIYVAHDPALPGVLVVALAEGIVLANAPADILALWGAFPWLWPCIRDAYDNDRIVDVCTREKMIDIVDGCLFRRGIYSLEAIAERRCGIELAKGDDSFRLRYGELLLRAIEDWPKAALSYALLDAVATWYVYVEQEIHRSRITAYDILADAPGNARAHLALYSQTVRGILTDQAAVDALDARLTGLVEQYEADCMAATVRMPVTKKKTRKGKAIETTTIEDVPLARHRAKVKRPSPVVRNKKAATAMLLELAAQNPRVKVLWTDPTDTFPEGQVSLSEDAMIDAMIPPGHPLESYRLLGSVKTQRTGWIVPLRSPVIRCRYNECIESSRTSSSEPSPPWIGRNLQNFPREGGYRECLVPRPGHVFVISDFGSLELVTLAQACLDVVGWSTLADALREGRSPHNEMAARLIGAPYDASNPEHKRKRTLAKALNFGFPGGLGAAKFVGYAARAPYFAQLTEQEARSLKAIWLDQWPEMRLFFEYVGSLEDNGLYTVVQRGGHVRGGMFFPDACNTHFQGPGATAAKRSLWRLYCAGLDPSSPMYGAYQVLFVHDEHVTECPRDRADAVAAEQERIMIESCAEVIPDVPITVETQIVDRYGK